MNIFIFHGFVWGIIRLYFKLFGNTLNSGSTSLRHKENLVGNRVSKFISWTGLEDKINFSLKNKYFDRYIDANILYDEIINNYKSYRNKFLVMF